MHSRQYAATYWENRKRVRGWYAEHRRDPLRVVDLLTQAVNEGRPLKLIWHDDESAAEDEPAERTTLLPAVPAAAFAGNDEDTEPNTAVRAGQQWLRRPDFSWWVQGLAG